MCSYLTGFEVLCIRIHLDAESLLSLISSPIELYISRFFSVEKSCLLFLTTSVGYHWVVLDMLGSRKTLDHLSRSELWSTILAAVMFPFSSPELWIARFCCVYAVVGLWTVWSGIEDWVCLRNLGLGSHLDRVRWLVFFSTTPEENWQGKSGLEGLWSKEGTDS